MNYLVIVLLFIILGILLLQSKSVPTKRSKQKNQMILDSCALIDGRIIEVIRTKFSTDTVIIPQFILNELQLLADGHDSHKRERARFGLDIAHDIQGIPNTEVLIDRNVFPAIQANDDKLIALAKKIQARLCTTDYNLAKVASVESIEVLNINELAKNLRPITLPGEFVSVKIVQKGSNNDQGVGYLDDGTMIVIDGSAKMLGKKIDAVVDRMHQTDAGKMVFAHLPKQSKPRSHR